MQEYTTSGSVEIAPDKNLTTALWEHEQENGSKAILSHRHGSGPFVDITYAEMAEQVRRIAAGFMALGLGDGDRICLFSPTRYEFTLFDYAIWAAGCATVTIYDSSSADQVDWIVSNSGAKAIVCATDDLKKVFLDQAGERGTCEHVISLEAGGMDELIAKGAEISDEDVLERAKSVGQDELATLVYTSGTTGRPKGCELTVGNFVWTAGQTEVVTTDVINSETSTLMFLPLAHIFARLAQVVSIERGSKIAFSTGVPQLMEELQMVRPTWMFSVPRVFEKIYNSAKQKADADGKGKVFDLATKVAINYSTEQQAGKVSLPTKIAHSVFDRLVYTKLRDVFGGRTKYAISGGAPLGERLGHFYSGVGITVIEGYGLTETTAASTASSPETIRVGTVGRPLPGSTVRIADDGEVLIKGGNVMRGYWLNPEATAESIDADGWLHTGDIGKLEDGYLRITGRKKEIIVTAGGKNVAPAVLEDLMRAHPLISQAMVVGDNQPFIATLITIDADEFPRWASTHGKSGTVADHVDDDDLRAAVQEAIDLANKAVSKAESIRTFRILPNDFSIEGGELTPTLKVKRRVVAEQYGTTIEEIYTK
ncbi:MAG TPA: long-chain fatty acid--CoA ligase [Acidimicrobiia bacterium]|jgi:long-chain acyl-CoA synthetase